ncbi:MAG TPA: pitrilysin family protein [Candidatus Dormibacteraeota bacterium]|jgi:zinc protease|nr:pitrilysin family protein [Candidatus Dormibacteraeota bacterium]
MKSKFVLALLVVVASCAAAKAQEVEIPYQKFVLDNGLTVIVHEDHKAPIVAVNTWYHVGSKNEKPGKTGFAHLFEHLMFGGSEHSKERYIEVMERIGATDLNGTTNTDRTNYFENVPTSAVDLTLWMESDRMGHLLGSFDEKTLTLQRGVVQNEKRQGENQPYGVTRQLITQNTYPAGHPYSWTTIGDMADLDAASMNDVKEWFKTYYGPSNVVLVLAGDIDLKTAKEKVQKYYGDIPSGPPVAHHEVWIAKMSGTHRQKVQDRVPQARIYKIWNIPQYGSAEADYLDLVSDVLSSGKSSRFYKRLVYDDQIATDAAAFVGLSEIGGQFRVQATARPGQDLKQVEKELDEELWRFLKEGPTADELARVKSQYEANFIRGIERIGGFGGKSDRLAQSQVFLGSPDAYKTSLKRVHDATAEDLKAVANKWLADGVYILEVNPFPDYKADANGADRSKPPVPGTPPELKLPKLQRSTLSNGLKVILAERHEVPLVNFTMAFDAGYAADQLAAPGTASLTMSQLTAGTKTMNALQISDRQELLGAQIGGFSNLDLSGVHLSALKSKLDDSLALYADVVLTPSFPQSDFELQKKQTLAGIKREENAPVAAALRLMPGLLYGADHAYGNPLTGSGTTASVSKLTRDDLVKFQDTWFKPNNATLVIVGDTTLGEITPKLEKLFSGWKPGNVPKKTVKTVNLPAKSVVYLIDKPGAQQSVIVAGVVAPPEGNPKEIAIEAMNDGLGGNFGARLNMNLREDKHWSYGASMRLWDARGQRPYLAIAPVQTDKTKESLVEMTKEFHDVVGSRPLSQEELEKVQANETLSLPGSRETQNAVGGSILDLVQFGLPDDYYETYAGKVRALKTSDLADAASLVVHPDKLTWVIVGDRAKIEAGVREVNLGELHLLDAQGKPVQ